MTALCPARAGDSPESGQAEIDEGFDEEFDQDVQDDSSKQLPAAAAPLGLPSSSSSSSDAITLTDIQQILAGGDAGGVDSLALSRSSLLEDIDAGVDLDPDQCCLGSGVEPLKSPASLQLPSPLGTAASPVVMASVELACSSVDHFDCRSGGLGVLAGLEDYSNVDHTGGMDFLDMICQPDLSPMSGSAYAVDTTASLYGYATAVDCQSICSDRHLVSLSPTPSRHTPTPPPPSLQSNTMLDFDPSRHTPTPPPVPIHNNVMLSGASLDLHSSGLEGGAYHVPLSGSHLMQQTGGCSWAGQSVTTTTIANAIHSAPVSAGSGTIRTAYNGTPIVANGGGACSTMCSTGSQTAGSSSASSSSPSPLPSTEVRGYSSPSPSPVYAKPRPQDKTAGSDDEPLSPKSKQLVSMPFFQFKKILDSPAIPEAERSQVKTIRRRGKNKVAAMNCRKRKLEVLCGLQQEIDRLKAQKTEVAVYNRGLEKEIESLRKRCSHRGAHS